MSPRIRESDRLRVLFLRYCGKRTYRAALDELGIEYHHGSGWINGRIILAEWHRARMWAAFQAAGITSSTL